MYIFLYAGILKKNLFEKTSSKFWKSLSFSCEASYIEFVSVYFYLIHHGWWPCKIVNHKLRSQTGWYQPFQIKQATRSETSRRFFTLYSHYIIPLTAQTGSYSSCELKVNLPPSYIVNQKLFYILQLSILISFRALWRYLKLLRFVVCMTW